MWPRIMAMDWGGYLSTRAEDILFQVVKYPMLIALIHVDRLGDSYVLCMNSMQLAVLRLEVGA